MEAIFESGSLTWIGGSEGLQLFDGQHFRDIAPADGDTFGSVSGLVETSEGNLWLNAVNGIVRIAPTAVSKLKAGGNNAAIRSSTPMTDCQARPSSRSCFKRDPSQRWKTLVRQQRRTGLARSRGSSQE